MAIYSDQNLKKFLLHSTLLLTTLTNTYIESYISVTVFYNKSVNCTQRDNYTDLMIGVFRHDICLYVLKKHIMRVLKVKEPTLLLIIFCQWFNLIHSVNQFDLQHDSIWITPWIKLNRMPKGCLRCTQTK